MLGKLAAYLWLRAIGTWKIIGIPLAPFEKGEPDIALKVPLPKGDSHRMLCCPGQSLEFYEAVGFFVFWLRDKGR